MTFFEELPDLQKIIIEIMVELLLIEKERRFPDLILNENVEDEKSVRITMHYIRALLAYDFAPHEDELQRGLQWFNTLFPRRKSQEIDNTEMNRLMMLLHLDPHNQYVEPRLRQLAKQRGSEFFDVQPGWQEFDTLWTIEVFLLAHEKGVLSEDIISLDKIRTYLNNLISEIGLKRDKDLALALRLYYQTYGRLEDDHIKKIEALTQRADTHSGLWGMREFGWKVQDVYWFKELTAGRKITYRDIDTENHHRNFHRTILSTCMVVENLIPLMNQFPILKLPIERAVMLLHKQFEDQNIITTLRNLFPKPHDYTYILVLCQTIRAFRAYLGERLLSLENTYLLKQITQLQPAVKESSEVSSIKQALRKWIQIDLTGQMERLKLGFSDANVVRVYPFIWSPMVSNEDRPRSLIEDSLIIKYGPRAEIEKERGAYEKLPPATQDYFVRIPQASYTDNSTGIAYVIMQDLRNYKTLYELRQDLHGKGTIENLSDQLSEFLQRMHRAGSAVKQMAPSSTIREIYLNKMLEYVDRVFNFIEGHELYPENSTPDEVRDIKYEIFEHVGEIIKLQHQIENFPSAYMHGDLHMRNIMVQGFNSNQKNGGLRFKLIDLEFMRAEGDAAFDAGQLVMDIDLVARDEKDRQTKENLLKLKRGLEQLYNGFSNSRQDTGFGVRLELAKARALLRIAKGKTKRGQYFVEAKQQAQADEIGAELIAHAFEALEHLRIVVEDTPQKSEV